MTTQTGDLNSLFLQVLQYRTCVNAVLCLICRPSCLPLQSNCNQMPAQLACRCKVTANKCLHSLLAVAKSLQSSACTAYLPLQSHCYHVPAQLASRCKLTAIKCLYSLLPVAKSLQPSACTACFPLQSHCNQVPAQLDSNFLICQF